MSLNGTVWTPIGPSPLQTGIDVNGQVTSIAVNPNNTKVIYIGTAWGGVWRTRDGGLNWTPLFDRAPSLGIGEPAAIAIDQLTPVSSTLARAVARVPSSPVMPPNPGRPVQIYRRWRELGPPRLALSQ
jgi:hypothetical protein